MSHKNPETQLETLKARNPSTNEFASITFISGRIALARAQLAANLGLDEDHLEFLTVNTSQGDLNRQKRAFDLQRRRQPTCRQEGLTTSELAEGNPVAIAVNPSYGSDNTLVN